MGFRSLSALGTIRLARFAAFATWLALATLAQAQVQITSTTLPLGGVNQAYFTTQLKATGGVPPYFWATPGMDTPSGFVTSLPPGLTLSSDGIISGTTTKAGVYPFHLDVFDSNQAKGSADVQIIVVDVTTASPLPNGQSNAPYSQQLSVTTGNPTWSIPNGQLPGGLTLSTGGLISGTPAATGLFTFIAQASVANGQAPPVIAQRTFQITITAGPLGFSTTSLPDGRVGDPYSQTVKAAGGTPPYTITASDSTLPPGITFIGSQLLTGTPTTPGTFAVQFQVRDSANGSANRTIPLTIAGSSSGPIVQITPANLRFTTFEGTGAGATQDLVITSTSGAAISISAAVAGGPVAPPSWLTVTNISSSTPAILRIRTNPGNLAPGTYQTILRITPGNQPAIDVPVSLTVSPAAPKMQVSPTILQTSSRAANPRTDLLLSLRNTGGGPAVDYDLTLANNSRWITKVAALPNRLSPSQPVLIRISVDISGLKPGAYRDELRIRTSIDTLSVPISLFVEEPGPILSVQVRGIRLAARVGDPADDKQTFVIRNRGTAGTTVNWTASIIRGADVFTLSATQGSATPGSPSPLTVGLKPAANTTAGGKSALLRISDSRSQGSPEYVVLIADVAANGGTPQTELAPAGLVFTAIAGATPPPAQSFEFRTSARSLSFTAATSTTDGANWLSIGAPSGIAGSGSPATVRVLVASSNLTPGIYTGLVTLSVGAQARSVTVTLIVLPSGSKFSQSESKSAPIERHADGCTPARVAIAQTALAESFSVPAGWPATLTVKLLDDCGTSLPNGDVIASFSNGDAPVVLEGDGLGGDYTATWQPGAAAAPAIVTLDASSGTLQAATLEITGGVDSNPSAPPSLVAAGLLNNLNPIVGAPLAPGTVTQIYGDNLTDTPAQPSNVPLPTQYKGVEAVIGGLSAPIYYISKNQLTVQVPSELAPNRLHSAILITDSGYSLPVPIPLVPVQPGTVQFPNGALVAQHGDANASLVTAANPAKPNEIVAIYLVGMGATNPAVPSGNPAPGATPGSTPATVNTNATVTVDNQPAEIVFQGLTPGGVGLYQINFRVPATAKAGSLDIVISQDGNIANSTKLIVAAP